MELLPSVSWARGLLAPRVGPATGFLPFGSGLRVCVARGGLGRSSRRRASRTLRGKRRLNRLVIDQCRQGEIKRASLAGHRIYADGPAETLHHSLAIGQADAVAGNLVLRMQPVEHIKDLALDGPVEVPPLYADAVVLEREEPFVAPASGFHPDTRLPVRAAVLKCVVDEILEQENQLRPFVAVGSEGSSHNCG